MVSHSYKVLPPYRTIYQGHLGRSILTRLSHFHLLRNHPDDVQSIAYNKYVKEKKEQQREYLQVAHELYSSWRLLLTLSLFLRPSLTLRKLPVRVGW
jgi:hypothetical protein